MIKNKTDDSLWTPTYISLITLGTLTSTSFYMIHPTISKYATLLGTSLGVAGIIAGLFSITALVGRPFGAVVVDRLNKKYVLSAATLVMGIASLGYSVAKSVILLIICRIIHGLAFAVSGTATVALISSIVSRKHLGEGIGYHGITHIIATALGPNIGIFIANKFGYNTNFLFAGILIIISSILITKIPYSQVTSSDLSYAENLSASGNNRRKISLDDLISFKVLPLALIGGIFSFMNGIVNSFLILLGEERDIKNIGLYFTVVSICLFIVRPLSGKLSDSKGLAFILYPAFLLVSLQNILLAHATGLFVVLLAAVAKAFGQGSAQPAIQATCLKKLDPAKSGVAAATYYIGADIGQGIGPMIGGAISNAYGYKAMFYFCVLLVLLGCIGFTIYNRVTTSQNELTNG
ncbi:MAG: MFS transporter [Clostridiales bacterium]|nr:MFS transporter [Clostridiales bacterium]